MTDAETREELLNATYGPGSGWERRQFTMTIRVPRLVGSPKDEEQLIREILDDAAFDITVDSFKETQG